MASGLRALLECVKTRAVHETNSTWRLRDRFQLTYPLNRSKTTDNGAVYLTGDSELFIPLDRGPGESRVSLLPRTRK